MCNLFRAQQYLRNRQNDGHIADVQLDCIVIKHLQLRLVIRILSCLNLHSGYTGICQSSLQQLCAIVDLMKNKHGRTQTEGARCMHTYPRRNAESIQDIAVDVKHQSVYIQQPAYLATCNTQSCEIQPAPCRQQQQLNDVAQAAWVYMLDDMLADVHTSSCKTSIHAPFQALGKLCTKLISSSPLLMQRKN